MLPEIAHCHTTRSKLASAGGASIPLLVASWAEEQWLRQAFIEAADWTNDPTYLPLVLRIDAASPTALTLR